MDILLFNKQKNPFFFSLEGHADQLSRMRHDANYPTVNPIYDDVRAYSQHGSPIPSSEYANRGSSPVSSLIQR